MFVKETKEHSLENINLAKITMILSFGSILLVSLVVSPIISKTEERKYLALNYFLNIPSDTA